MRVTNHRIYRYARQMDSPKGHKADKDELKQVREEKPAPCQVGSLIVPDRKKNCKPKKKYEKRHQIDRTYGQTDSNAVHTC